MENAAETLPGWDQAAAFAADVLRIADIKQRSNLEAALRNLRGQAQVLESFFQTGPVVAWNVSSFPIENRHVAAALSTDLYQALVAFLRMQSSVPATYSEWLSLQAESRIIAGRIPALYSELNSLRQPDEPGHAEAPDSSLQTQASDQLSAETSPDQELQPPIESDRKSVV